MRQAGVIAAPGIIALTRMVDRLAEDHHRAEILRKGLEALGIKVDRDRFLTNIINLDPSPAGMDAPSFAQKLLAFNIKIKVCNPSANRMVLHHDIMPQHIDFVLETIKKILKD